MFGWGLNTPLADNGRRSQRLKKYFKKLLA